MGKNTVRETKPNVRTPNFLLFLYVANNVTNISCLLLWQRSIQKPNYRTVSIKALFPNNLIIIPFIAYSFYVGDFSSLEWMVEKHLCWLTGLILPPPPPLWQQKPIQIKDNGQWHSSSFLGDLKKAEFSSILSRLKLLSIIAGRFFLNVEILHS